MRRKEGEGRGGWSEMRGRGSEREEGGQGEGRESEMGGEQILYYRICLLHEGQELHRAASRLCTCRCCRVEQEKEPNKKP